MSASDERAKLDREVSQDLTPRERRDWESLMAQLPSPCPEPRGTLQSCLDAPSCAACVPGARMLLKGVKDGRATSQVIKQFELRFSPDTVRNIDVQDAPSIGPASAPITIVEFADFQCPFCAQASGKLDELVQRYAPNVRVIFKHYPLPSHSYGELAAKAAVAAQNQGKFWELHHKMFDNQRSLSPAEIDRLAQDSGLDMNRFKLDLQSPETAARVKRSREQGDRVGVKGTPSVFINGRYFDFDLFDFGGPDLLEWIDLELLMKTGRKPPPPAASSSASASASAPALVPELAR